MTTVVYGLVDSDKQMSELSQKLRDAGFRQDDIAALSPDHPSSRDFIIEGSSRFYEGAVIGSSAGWILGFLVGYGLVINLGAFPALDALVAAGPLVSGCAGAAIMTVIGGLSGAYIGHSIPVYAAKRYDGQVAGNHCLLSVHADDTNWEGLAKQILTANGAHAVGSGSEGEAPAKSPIG